jgi:hypothetical protein
MSKRSYNPIKSYSLTVADVGPGLSVVLEVLENSSLTESYGSDSTEDDVFPESRLEII